MSIRVIVQNVVLVLLAVTTVWSLWNNYQQTKLHRLYGRHIGLRAEMNAEYGKAIDRIHAINEQSEVFNRRLDYELNDLRLRFLHRFGIED